MRRASLALTLLLALPCVAQAQETLSDRHPEEHELVAAGFQIRAGHMIGDNASWDIGGTLEVAGVLDIRFGDRSHWHMRLVTMFALSTDRGDFNTNVMPYRFGARLFPVAVGFGSDLVTMRLGAELAVTEVQFVDRFSTLPPPGRPGPIPPSAPEVIRSEAAVHFGPTVELAFEVLDGLEVMIYGSMPIVPVLYGEYGVSFAALFW